MQGCRWCYARVLNWIYVGDCDWKCRNVMKELRSRGLPALQENSIIKHASGTSNMPTCVRSDNPVVFIAFRVSSRVISAKYIFPGTAFLKNMVAMLYTDIRLASSLFTPLYHSVITADGWEARMTTATQRKWRKRYHVTRRSVYEARVQFWVSCCREKLRMFGVCVFCKRFYV